MYRHFSNNKYMLWKRLSTLIWIYLYTCSCNSVFLNYSYRRLCGTSIGWVLSISWLLCLIIRNNHWPTNIYFLFTKPLKLFHSVQVLNITVWVLVCYVLINIEMFRWYLICWSRLVKIPRESIIKWRYRSGKLITL